MRAVDSDSFNKKVWDQIEKIKYIIENRITPENIKHFDGTILKYARDLLANEDYLKVDWSHNSNVNSYELSKIRQMIDYLKTSQTQQLVVGGTINIGYYKDRSTGTTTERKRFLSIDKLITIPENYDGRNSFWFYYTLGGNLQIITPTSVINNGMNYNILETDGKAATLTIDRRKTDALVRLKIPNGGNTDAQLWGNGLVNIFGLVWRLL